MSCNIVFRSVLKHDLTSVFFIRLLSITKYMWEQAYAPKTKHKYYDSVWKFGTFLLSYVGPPIFPGLPKDDVRSIVDQLQGYKDGLRKPIKQREAENRFKIAGI